MAMPANVGATNIHGGCKINIVGNYLGNGDSTAQKPERMSLKCDEMYNVTEGVFRNGKE